MTSRADDVAYLKSAGVRVEEFAHLTDEEMRDLAKGMRELFARYHRRKEGTQ